MSKNSIYENLFIFIESAFKIVFDASVTLYSILYLMIFNLKFASMF